MTTTIRLDEALRNATLAALDERAARLLREIESRERLVANQIALDVPRSEDIDRALVWNIAALHECQQARLVIGEAEPATADPGEVSYHDWQARV